MYIAGIQTEEQQYNEQFVIMFTLVMTQLKQVRNMIDFSVVHLLTICSTCTVCKYM